MANKKFKIILMGAPGAGKTVFLSSYFHLTANLGRGSSIRPNAEGASGEIERLVKGLLSGKVTGEEKAITELLGFTLDSPAADVQFTGDPDALFPSSGAKGVVVLLPSDELDGDPEKVLRENRPNFEALSSFLADCRRREEKKEAIPVLFLFTKGDKTPRATASQLMEKLKGLLTPEDPRTIALSKFLEEEPDKTKCFKVTAVGSWPDDYTLPIEYEPQNVLKPMEELYKTMSNHEVEKKQIKTALIAIVVLLFLTTALTWGMSYRRWGKAEKEVKNLLASSRYEDALALVDSFGESYVFPDPIPLVPSFLRGGANKKGTVDRIYKAYEEGEFRGLQNLLEGLDTSVMPDVKSGEYLAAAEKAKKYLENSAFKAISPKNHEKILSLKGYFELGQALSEKISGEDTADPYSLLEKWLAYLPKLPEQWSGEGAKKSVELFTSWAGELSPDASIEAIQEALAKAVKIGDDPNAGEELKNAATEQKADWEGRIATKWIARGEEWVKDAASAPLEEAVGKLGELMKREDIPQIVRETIGKALEDSYNSFAAAIVGDLKLAAQDLKTVLAGHPQMPGEARQKLQDRIVAIARGEAEALAAEMEALDSLKALGAAREKLSLSWPDFPDGKELVAKAFDKTLATLADRELERLAEQGNLLKEKGDFKGAKGAYEGSLEKLEASLEGAGFDESSLPDSFKADDILGVKLKELREAHLSVCKANYEKLKTKGGKDDISPVLEELKAYAELWAGSAEAEEASSAAAYLSAVSKGVKAVLTIVAGNFPKEDSLFGSPEFKATLRAGGKTLLETKVASGIKPAFGERLDFTWDSGTKLEVEAVKLGGMFSSDEKILRATLDATGITGYEKLGQTVKSGDNSLSLKLDIQLPKSPW